MPALATNAGNAPGPDRNVNLMSAAEKASQSGTQNVLKAGSEQLSSLVKNNPSLNAISERFGVDTLQKTVVVCEINPLAKLNEVTIKDMQAIAEKISVLQSKPEWTKLAVDQVTGGMTISSVNKAYAQVQSMTSLGQANQVVKSSLSSSVDVQTAVKSDSLKITSFKNTTTVIAHKISPPVRALADSELNLLLANNPELAGMVKKVGFLNVKNAVEVCKINPTARLKQGAICHVESTAQKIKIINSNDRWKALAKDPETGLMSASSVELVSSNIKGLANKELIISGRQRLCISQAPKKVIVGSKWGQPSQINDVYEGAFSKKGKDHIFSEAHEEKGILDLGKRYVEKEVTKQKIFNKLKKMLLKIDKAGLLVEGDNEIRFIMNGHEATMRVFMQNNTLMSWDAFATYSERVKGNLLLW